MHSTPSFLGVGLLVYSCIVTVFNTVLKTISKHLLKLPYHLLFQSKPTSEKVGGARILDVPQRRDSHLHVLSLAGKVFPKLLGVMKAASSLLQPSETSVWKRANPLLGLEIWCCHGPAGLKWFFIDAAVIIAGTCVTNSANAVTNGSGERTTLCSSRVQPPESPHRSSHWCQTEYLWICCTPVVIRAAKTPWLL